MGQLSTILRNGADDRLTFWCPGCGGAHGFGVTRGRSTEKPQRWHWNGDVDRPTFQPSILVRTHRWTPPVTSENLADWRRAPWHQEKVQHRCHSYVTDGQIQFLSDCTHALAGKTVPLGPWPWAQEWQAGD